MDQLQQEIRLKITYSKTGRAKYISHLDTIEIISKAIRRANIHYEVSKGCHVRPKLIFGAPLPLGHASFCEYFILTVQEKINLENLIGSLSNQFPEGMVATNAEFLSEENKSKAQLNDLHYRFTFTSEQVAKKAFEFLNNPESTFEAFQKKKLRKYSIGNAVEKIIKSQEDKLHILEIDFTQGTKGTPSVSKIVTALANMLGDEKIHFTNIERISFNRI